MSFASLEEFGDFLGVNLDPGQGMQAQLLLDFATGEMQVYIGQTIQLVEDDEVTVDAPQWSDILFLPELPVIEISDVTVDGTALDLPDDIAWYDYGAVHRSGAWWWSDTTPGRNKVVVTYSHGYEVIPAALKAVCCSLAARLMEGKNGVSVDAEGNPGRASTILRAGVVGVFTDEEQRVMDAYRLVSVA